MFQFHFGSIGRTDPLYALYSLVEFQFHFGSIGRIQDRGLRLSLRRFNSTLVRLEDYTISRTFIETKFQFHFGSIGSKFRQPTSRCSQSFNSTLVRLEVAFVTNPILLTMFQFHFGSIGSTWNLWIFNFFNVSIPLWFDWKLKAADGTIVNGWCFNSTLVRLEEQKAIEYFNNNSSFNSTLVRLEERPL